MYLMMLVLVEMLCNLLLYPDKIVFSILVAPAIHADTKYMAGYSKYQYNVDILTYAIEEFIKDIAINERLVGLLHQ